MRIKFHGGRGSHPVPVDPSRIDEISAHLWELSQKNPGKSWVQAKASLLNDQPRANFQIYGGATTCIEVKDDTLPMPLFFDAGTGLTGAATDAASGLNNPDFTAHRGKAAIFFTHTHWDHIQGLTTIPQIFQDGNEFHLYSVHKQLQNRLSVLFQDEYFPVPFRTVGERMHFHQIDLGSITRFGEFEISHFGQTHPGASFAYRVSGRGKTFVFATDTELKNIQAPHLKPGQNIYSNADLLVLDAHFSPEEAKQSEGWGHASIHAAVELALREKVKKLCLFHQSPFYSDKEIDRQLVRAQEHRQKHQSDSPLTIVMMVEGAEISI